MKHQDRQRGRGGSMSRRRLLKLASASLAGAVASRDLQRTAWSAEMETVVFEPETIDGVITNPGMGFETFHCFNGDERARRAENHPDCSIAYFRFYWDKVEPAEGEYDFDMVDSLLERAKASGQQLALRFMPTSQGSLREGTPQWFIDTGKGFAYGTGRRRGWAPDHNDPYFLAKQEELVTAFGERYDGHPGVIRMEIGSVGFWGEWHLSGPRPELPMITEENALRVIDMYLKHWGRTPLCMLIGYVPGLRYAVSRGAGWRADSLGDYGHFSDNWCHMVNAYPAYLDQADAHDAWKRGPVGFEPPGSMADLERYVPSKGGGYDKMWDQALAWHGSVYNAKSGSIPADQVAPMNRFLERCGYRLALRRVALSQHPGAGDRRLQVAMEFENTGVAPPYRDYVPAVKLEAGGEPIVLETSARPREWLPGRHVVEEELLLPAPLAPGKWAVSVALLEPSDRRPAIKLANAGVDADGWCQLGALSAGGR